MNTNTTQTRNVKQIGEDFLKLKFGMFIHFNMSTFVPGGWSHGDEDPMLFNPTKMDCGQWADAAVSAGMTYITLTVKHTGGWCLWPTRYTPHNISLFKNYKNGEGDIVREFVEACRSRGLKIGFYYCFPLYHPDWAQYSTLPIEGYESGTCDSITFIKNQFTELLTQYGDIDIIWIDQSGTLNGGMKEGDYQSFKNHVHELQPDCTVIANNQTDYTDTDIFGYEYPWSLELPSADNKEPVEVCDKLNQGWFSDPKSTDTPPVRSVDYIVNRMLIPLNNGNAVYLLNCAPNKLGLMSDATVVRLKEIGEAWRNTENKNIKRRDLTLTQIDNKKNLAGITITVKENPSIIQKVLPILNENNVHATFFICGSTINDHKDILKNAAADGHDIGLMGMNYTNTEDYECARLLGTDLREAEKMLKTEISYSPVCYRAPFNTYNKNTWDVIHYLEMLPVDSSISFLNSTGEIGQIASGTIIEIGDTENDILHLQKVIETAKSSGLTLVSVPKLVKNSDNKYIKNYLLQRQGKAESGEE
jgi:alpha-L-fucosidase